MSLRGPQRSPNSVRGQRQAAKAPVAVVASVAKKIEPPEWLTEPEAELFRSVVADAIAANVPVLEVDTLVFANIAVLQKALETETDANKRARFARTLLTWATAAGLTAVGRARLNIVQEKPKESATARLLAMTRRPS
jgi:hypothetical protein